MSTSRTLFYVAGLNESTKAFQLLLSKSIDFLDEEVSSTNAQFGRLPLLMVGDRKWEGLDEIEQYVEDWPNFEIRYDDSSVN